VRLGAGLSWLPNKNWTVTCTCDVDRVSSDDASRKLARQRFALGASFVF
jgi:hypothetical protein